MIKNIRLKVVLLLVCISSVLGVYAKSFVAIEDVKVRAGKDSKSASLGKLKKGTIIDVEPIDDTWGKVTYKGKTGYVTSEYFDEPPPSENAAQSSAVPPAGKKELSENDKKLMMFIGGVIVFLIVIKRVLHYRSEITDRRKKAAEYEKETAYQPKFWYQCKHCWVTVRRESAPNSEGCFNAPDHHWFELAEYGKTRYLCKKCSTVLNVRSEPATADCKGGEMHFWEKLPA